MMIPATRKSFINCPRKSNCKESRLCIGAKFDINNQQIMAFSVYNIYVDDI